MAVIVEPRTIEKWEHLSELVSQFAGKGWIFRGVHRERDQIKVIKGMPPTKVRGRSYSLIPSIGRPNNTQQIGGGERKLKTKDEKALLQLFKREARTRFEYTPDADADLEWLVLGQHHRLYTRLLDWSESVLVAAFFAVESPPIAGAIYGVKAPLDLRLDADPFKYLPSPRLVRPPHINPRITAQKGVLTLHPNPTQAWEDSVIHCWEISRTPVHSLEIKRKLAFAGIHEASLFPDSADRHTAYLSWRHKWDDLPTFSRSNSRKKAPRAGAG